MMFYDSTDTLAEMLGGLFVGFFIFFIILGIIILIFSIVGMVYNYKTYQECGGWLADYAWMSFIPFVSTYIRYRYLNYILSGHHADTRSNAIIGMIGSFVPYLNFVVAIFVIVQQMKAGSKMKASAWYYIIYFLLTIFFPIIEFNTTKEYMDRVRASRVVAPVGVPGKFEEVKETVAEETVVKETVAEETVVKETKEIIE